MRAHENTIDTCFVAVILITVAAISTIHVLIPTEDSATNGRTGLKKFSSYEEMENFIMAGYQEGMSWSIRIPALAPPLEIGPTTNTVDHSTTNIQVEGVDEADIVKTNGKYVYVVSGNKVFIIDAYPAENARILSEIKGSENPREIFINGDKLTVLGWKFIKIYDVSNRENPVLKREISFDGYYFNSRMIGDYVYVIINAHVLLRPIPLPWIRSGGEVKIIPATEIYYFEDLRDYSYQFTTIMAINTQNDDEKITSETFLIGLTQNIFVSVSNIYITYPTHTALVPARWQDAEKTIVHKISIAGGKIEYKSQGEVPGYVLNQFSMDEYQGYLRIATTTGDVWNGSARNHVYVLNEDLSIVGKLEGLAPGERIYSVRFMGNRAYLVTFKEVDPLFVIDLTDLANPRVIGELKIPGYSDYLHPYDEAHIIGVGKDTVESEWGDFAWYQGVKIALFDVSDPENPKEISKYIIGQRGTESYALRDHRAFLFNKSKNLLVIPISLVENGPSWWQRGYNWQGAYVFGVSSDNGFTFRGGITHSEYSVKRSLYIDNVLYTISDGLVKMNDLADLDEINTIRLA